MAMSSIKIEPAAIEKWICNHLPVPFLDHRNGPTGIHQFEDGVATDLSSAPVTRTGTLSIISLRSVKALKHNMVKLGNNGG